MKIINQSEQFDLSTQVMRTIYEADGSSREAEDTIVREHFLDVYVNERIVSKIVCTPSHLVELVLGRLVTERIITDTEDVESLYICERGHTAKVFLKEEKSDIPWKEEVVTEPSCCTGNKTLLTNVGADALQRVSPAEFKPEWIFAMADIFAEDSQIHKKTKGTHSAYLGRRGQCIFRAEDIGRHNALDKCIGHMMLENLAPQEMILFTTGRVPTDMVKKAVAAKVPILASKAVPTDAAVELAREFGLTLVCKAWPDRMEVYANGK